MITLESKPEQATPVDAWGMYLDAMKILNLTPTSGPNGKKSVREASWIDAGGWRWTLSQGNDSPYAPISVHRAVKIEDDKGEKTWTTVNVEGIGQQTYPYRAASEGGNVTCSAGGYIRGEIGKQLGARIEAVQLEREAAAAMAGADPELALETTTTVAGSETIDPARTSALVGATAMHQEFSPPRGPGALCFAQTAFAGASVDHL